MVYLTYCNIPGRTKNSEVSIVVEIKIFNRIREHEFIQLSQ